MMKVFGVILGSLFMAGVCVFADCRHVRVVQHHQAVAVAAVVTPVVAAVFTPIPVVVPTYSVGYADHGGTDAQVLEELRGLRQQVQELKAQANVAPMPLKQALSIPKGLAIMQTKCAICHGEKSKNTVLFRSGAFVDEGENASRVIEQIDAGLMPKGGKLSDSDKYEILKLLTVKVKEAASK